MTAIPLAKTSRWMKTAPIGSARVQFRELIVTRHEAAEVGAVQSGVFTAAVRLLQHGRDEGAERPVALLQADRPGLNGEAFWLHFDVDVLDRAVMPAVDTPGSPGIELAELTALLGMLTQLPRCYGMTLTIFDPDLDPYQRSASLLVKLLASVFG